MQNASDSSRALNAPPLPTAKFTINPKAYSGPRAEDVLQQRAQHLSAGQYHFYKIPLMLVEASMQYCFDDKGKVYVDGYSNVCHVGHCHPHFVNSCQQAMANIISNTRYLHPNIGRYAEKLKSTLPSSLSVCYFVNSGSEANDLAMRLARVHTQRHNVICLEYAYHGTTATCTGVSTSLSTGTTKGTVDYEYCARDISVATLPDVYRGKYSGPDAGRQYAESVADLIKEKGEVAAYIHESVQGVGGQIVYPKDYLGRVYKHVRAAGGVTIADEVQTGFGRTGSHFWAFQAQNVVPDIVVMGKPIGNGFPLGAVVCTREIARSFDGVQYFNTNGGNPVACAAGLAVLEIIERDGLQKNALDVSVFLMKELTNLKERHELIGDVRGVGLFIGLELVRDRKTKEPANKECAEVMERCRHFGLLVGKGGYNNNVIRMKPPLCFNKEDAAFAVKTLDLVLGEVACAHKNTKHDTPVNEPIPNTYVNSTTPRNERYNMAEDDDDRIYATTTLSSTPRSNQRLSRIPRQLMRAVENSYSAEGKGRSSRQSRQSYNDETSDDEGPRGSARRRPHSHKRTRSDGSSSDGDVPRPSSGNRLTPSRFALH